MIFLLFKDIILMPSFKLSHVSPLDSSFHQYLINAGDFMQDHDSLLLGLQQLNSSHQPRIVFINSKCSKKGFLCINCKDDEYSDILSNLEQIIQLHNAKKNNIGDIVSFFK